MRQEEWVRLFRKFPLNQQCELVLILGNREEIAVDQVVRFESNYAVFRGRVAGTDNEGRAFFVPYEHMCYLRIEKVVSASDVQIIYGDTSPAEQPKHPPVEEVRPAPAESAADNEPRRAMDSEEVRDKLLQRIRSTRSSGGGPASSLGS